LKIDVLTPDQWKKRYCRYFQGAMVRSGAGLMIWLFALAALFIDVIKCHHFLYVSLVVACLILINPPTLFILKYILHDDPREKFSLFVTFLEIIGYTLIIYFLGGMDAAFLTPVYAALITYVGVLSPKKNSYVIASACAMAFSLIVVLEGLGIIPRQQVDPYFGTNWLYRFDVLFIIIGLLFVVAYIASFAAGELEKTRNAFHQKKQELVVTADKLAETHQKLIDLSCSSGIAEMAGGVLHNIGNAMIPLNMSLMTLNDALKISPVAEVELAVNELAEPSTPVDRREDLSRFLELVGSELAKTIVQTREQVLAIMHQTRHVRQILMDHAKYSRDARVLEPVDIGTLVIEANQMLSPKMKLAMKVDISPAVHELGAALGSRVALLQVVTNVLINAAESIVESAVDDGCLVVRGSCERVEGRSMIHLRFEDNGTGIPEENLDYIFARGFSTKGRGSGLGLHWSANTINALNGCLHAESEGLGKGACVHLILPKADEVNDGESGTGGMAHG
jgi:signal transduction histidine kinase